MLSGQVWKRALCSTQLATYSLSASRQQGKYIILLVVAVANLYRVHVLQLHITSPSLCHTTWGSGMLARVKWVVLSCSAGRIEIAVLTEKAQAYVFMTLSFSDLGPVHYPPTDNNLPAICLTTSQQEINRFGPMIAGSYFIPLFFWIMRKQNSCDKWRFPKYSSNWYIVSSKL